MTKTITGEIVGISPLLMHRYPLAEGGSTPKGFDKWEPERQAEFNAYFDPETKELRVQAEAIRQAMITAAKWTKGKGRASLKTEVAASVLLSPEWLGLGTTDYVIDTRSAVNQNTRGRILVHRPRFDTWSLSFTLTYDPVLTKPSELHEVLSNAGSRVGIGPFRPDRRGMFGRFTVCGWQED